jgi:hypothetical protein
MGCHTAEGRPYPHWSILKMDQEAEDDKCW